MQDGKRDLKILRGKRAGIHEAYRSRRSGLEEVKSEDRTVECLGVKRMFARSRIL